MSRIPTLRELFYFKPFTLFKYKTCRHKSFRMKDTKVGSITIQFKYVLPYFSFRTQIFSFQYCQLLMTFSKGRFVLYSSEIAPGENSKLKTLLVFSIDSIALCMFKNLKECLRKLKSEIQKEQRKAYWSYIQNVIFDIPIPEQGTPCQNKTPKNLFSYIKTQKTESNIIPPLRADGILKSDALSKANILNKQFQTAFTPDNNDHIRNKGPSPYQPMHDINVTTPCIQKLLSNLKPHKAAGPDKIKTEVL